MKHLSAFDLDALAMGAPSLDAGASEHLAACEQCSNALLTIERDQEHFEQVVLRRTLDTLARPKPSPWRRLLNRRSLVPALVAFAILLLFIKQPGQELDSEPELGIKGSSLLQIVVLDENDRTRAIRSGDALKPGDKIRFVVTPNSNHYLLIASLDGLGQISIFYPYNGQSSAAIPLVPKFEVPDSIILDHSPGPERIFAFLSQEPLLVSELQPLLVKLSRLGHRALRDQDSLELPVAQSSVLIEKRAE